VFNLENENTKEILKNMRLKKDDKTGKF